MGLQNFQILATPLLIIIIVSNLCNKHFSVVTTSENQRSLEPLPPSPRASPQSLSLRVSSFIAEGLAQWLRSLPPNPEVPGSIPGLVEG